MSELAEFIFMYMFFKVIPLRVWVCRLPWMRCTARKAFPSGNLCFSEKWSKVAAKARAIAAPSTSTGADLKPGPQTGILRSRLKERCQSRDALKSTARPRRTPFFSARSAVTRACL